MTRYDLKKQKTKKSNKQTWLIVGLGRSHFPPGFLMFFLSLSVSHSHPSRDTSCTWTQTFKGWLVVFGMINDGSICVGDICLDTSYQLDQ